VEDSDNYPDSLDDSLKMVDTSTGAVSASSGPLTTSVDFAITIP